MMEFARNLRVTSPMMRGDDVLAVQQRVFGAGQLSEQDGLYGNGTGESVKRFQANQGLEVDGIVGIATWAKLFPGTSPGIVQHADLVVSDILTVQHLSDLRTRHGFFSDGCQWSLGLDGITVHERGSETAPTFTAGERAMVDRILTDFSQPIASTLAQIQVPVELLIACMCAESGGRADAKRLEPGGDKSNPERTPGRVSWGLMQTLLSTARSVMSQPALPLPDLLKPDVSIRAGASYMWLQARRTKFDPPLVAAAYNAGSLRFEGSSTNRWRLVQYPIGTSAHVDRFSRYFNAAMAAVGSANLPAAVPSFRHLLA